MLVTNKKNKISNTLKEKYKTGERVPVHNAKSEEERNRISETLKNKYKSQEHHSKGKPSWNKGKKIEKDTECPHCGKILDKSNAYRWHFDNCKLSESYKIPEYKPMSEDCKNKISEKLKIKYETQIHHMKGKNPWNKGKEMEKIECPHCKVMIDKLNAKNWHFDNCKLKK